MKKEKDGPAKDLKSETLNKTNYFGVFKAEQFHVCNIPVRLGKRKLCCGCGGRLLVKRIGLFGYLLECSTCHEQKALSILAYPEEVRT